MSSTDSKIVLTLIICFVAIFAVGIYNDKMKPASLSSPGWFVDSITQSKIISNDADLADANFIVSATAGGGQTIVGTLDPADFKQKLPESSVQYPLRIEMNNVQEYLTYPIVNGGALYRYTIQFRDHNGLNGVVCYPETGEQCYPIDSPGVVWSGYTRMLVISKVYTGNWGQLDSPNINWKGNIIMSINGVPLKASNELGSGEVPGSAEFRTADGEYVGGVAWEGSLVTGQAQPSEAKYRVIYTPYGDRMWKVVPASYFDLGTNSWQYKFGQAESSLSAERQKVLNAEKALWQNGQPPPEYYPCGTDPQCPAIAQFAQDANNALDTLIEQNTKIDYSSALATSVSQSVQNQVAGAESTPGSQNMGSIVAILDRTFTTQKFQIIVRAKSLAVEIMVGKPQIVKIEAPKFGSGDATGVAKVTFKNAGTASGRFAATFIDSSGIFTPSSNVLSTQLTLGAGETGTVNVYIDHGTSAQPTNKLATMRVYDINKPSNYAEQGFQISMTVPKACQPGAVRTDKGLVYQCNAGGSGEDIIMTCLDGLLTKDAQYPETGGYNCVVTKADGTTTSGGTTAGGDKTSGVVVKKATFVDWYNTLLAKIFGALILIEIGLGVTKAQELQKKKKKH